MKKVLSILALSGVLMFASCDSKKEEKQEETQMDAAPMDTTAAMPMDSAGTMPMDSAGAMPMDTAKH